jgi:UDP-N-acetylmuramate--alanine ligase
MRIHFIGIGGIGVSALAQYYLAKGHKVFGSDLGSSEITESLKKAGAKIIIGEQSAKNVPNDVDLVIYSPAVQKNNPEFIQANKLKASDSKLNILSYPEALGKLTKKYFTIAVSGTHGKSTTTALLSLILIKAGLNPTVIIGTKLREFNDSNFRLGGSPKAKSSKLKTNILVIEADEHFASFLNYQPKMIVLTNIDVDHLDFYKNLGNIKKTFKKYVSLLPKDGILIANKDDKNSINGFLKNKNAKWFSLKQPEAKKLKNILKIPGSHIVSDALAALEAARCLKIPDNVSFAALSRYNGAWRRFEIVQKTPFVLISDYGHNPSKMLATLQGAREKYPDRKIWCIYQPHQYQRTYFLFKKFIKAFGTAPTDKIIITDIFDVAGREEKQIKESVSSEKLAEAVKKSSVSYLAKDKIVNYLKENIKNKDVVVIMGAGDIYQIIPDIKI